MRLLCSLSQADAAAAPTVRVQETWRWIQELPDANGRPHGVSLGSLENRGERAAGSMKPTAASLR